MGNSGEFLNINPESASIQTHLGIMQNVIQRMAANSSSSKAWCVALVSAILVVVADKHEPAYAWIALFPVIIFAALDAYYLALEKAFRESYNNFVSKLHQNRLSEEDLYSVKPSGDLSAFQIEAFKSFSIWGLYLSLATLVGISSLVING